MIAFEYLYNRRVPIVYTAPAVCEFDFSGTGEPSIYLAPIERVLAPSGLVLGGEGGFTIFWGVVRGALCYSVYKAIDPDDPFGPYELVAECITNNWWEAPDPGVYKVETITIEGTSELSDPVEIPTGGGPPGPPPPPPPPPATCGNGSPAVPELLLEDLNEPEVVVTGTTNGCDLLNDFPFEVTPGQFASRWVSGHVWARCIPGVFEESWIPHAYWKFGATLLESWTIGWQYGCYNASGGPPPDCTPPVEDQLLAQWPDKLMETNTGSPAEIILDPVNPWVGQTHNFVMAGSPNGASCTPDCGGDYTLELVKIKDWIIQPEFVTISNWASIRKSLFCNADADAGPAWNGVIGDSVLYAINGFQLAEQNHGEYVGSAQVAFGQVWLVAGIKWTLTLMAYIGGNLTTVFYGEKYYGRTCVGNYGRISGCTEETCVTLV